MDIGLEKVENFWCVFKKTDKEYWLDQNKKWTTNKFKRAGIKDLNKAKNLIQKLWEEEKCTIK